MALTQRNIASTCRILLGKSEFYSEDYLRKVSKSQACEGNEGLRCSGDSSKGQSSLFALAQG